MMRLRFLLVLFLLPLAGLQAVGPFQWQTHTDENGLQYKAVQNDPLQTRVYTLANGLTVYLSENHDAPRIFTAVAVRTGSKHDPADNTGLAHYLEHLMFKGTPRFGSLNWEKEKPLLDQITVLYEKHARATNDAARAEIYRQIDSLAGLAAQYAVPNAYDRVLSQLGTKYTNAFTSNEQTVYLNDIPSNALAQWAKLEAERFADPVFRLFHTELETVYEEKNRAIDSDTRRAYEVFFEKLFPTHNYGQQTTLGDAEHLKRPSIQTIEAYFRQQYVPNNMAIILAGDFDADETIQLIRKSWATAKPGSPMRYEAPEEQPIQGPITAEVVGPSAASVAFGYRLPGRFHPDWPALEILDGILKNGTAGLIDLNLLQTQKVLDASCFFDSKNDYGYAYFSGTPRSGQALETVVERIQEQIELAKAGKITQEMVDAEVNQYRLRQIQFQESNQARVFQLADVYTSERDYLTFVSHAEQLDRVTPEQVQAVAKKYFPKSAAVIVYKRQGDNPDLPKIPKPPITPVQINRDAFSEFSKALLAEPRPEVEPEFIDPRTAVTMNRPRLEPNTPKVEYWAKKNEDNYLFSLYYVLDFGRKADRELALAVQYLDFLGAGELDAAHFKTKMYRLGASYGVSVGEDRTYVYVRGLQENFEAIVDLFERWLATPKVDPQAYELLVQSILKEREDAKKDKRVILQRAMVNYAKHGPQNPFTAQFSAEELAAQDPAKLAARVAQLNRYPHRVLYYGPLEPARAFDLLEQTHAIGTGLLAPPRVEPYPHRTLTQPELYFVHYPMVQAEAVWLIKAEQYRPEVFPQQVLFNQYFGGDMSSIVFQELREAQGLAYTAFGTVSTPDSPKEPYYAIGYIGTQADKLPEAVTGMEKLLQGLIYSETAFESAKEAVLNQFRTDRTLRDQVFFELLTWEKYGRDEDPARLVFSQLPDADFDLLSKFYGEMILNRPAAVLVIGDRSRVDMDFLQAHGKFQELTLEQIFGY